MPNKFLNRIHKNDLKILLLTDGIPPFIMGGMQRHSFNLAKYFTFAGVDITLVHCVQMKECIETSIPSEIEVNEFLFGKESSVFIESICLQFPAPSKLPGHYIRNSYRYSELVYEKIKSRLNEFDFIYAKGFSAWKLLKEKKLGLKCPPVGIKFHGYEMYQTAANLKMKLEHFMLRPAVKWNTLNADVVFSYGGKITDIIKSLRVSKDKIIEATSGVDENIIRDPLEINVNLPLKFCFVGRYERRKGVGELTLALKQLLKNGVQFEFHFVGPIPIDKQIEKYEKNLTFLATVGSVAPFVGLFGTVWGIMNSFQSIAISRNTSLAIVAPGIAEALFATALGLLAAIPAVVAYNKFSSDSRRYTQKLENFTQSFLTII